eukprot:TRINITY_DN759_c0_g1_i2.p1 TRINITY_DN759_c0_g1~~TRINITY_DN759_c0_g1_i2.p1  ORF type:complete len:587 (-),score=151.19 TRINITY_DN759_c0_g1_i2:79-1839(-)
MCFRQLVMEGEIEDRISLQDCSHTGSISFGRFEGESLCWERRSSFSHNRYLEEVEKYSRPGSVTEKKAYFEAHFKKKALLRQISTEEQNGAEQQNTENDIRDDMNYMEEFEGHDSEGSRFVHYDESPDWSIENECEVMECEREGEEILPSEFQVDPTITNIDEVDTDIHNVEPTETPQTVFESNALLLVKNDLEIEVEQELVNEAENVNELYKEIDASEKSIMAAKDHNPSFKKTKKPSLKVKATTEQKATKSKLRTQVSVAQIPVKIPNEKTCVSTGKAFTKTPKKMERANQLQDKTEKQSPMKDWDNVKAKISEENRCEKGLKMKKVGSIPQPVSDKDESKGYQSASRTKRIVNSIKTDLKPSAAVFNFKSDERAEKRKEFYMRLEEKLHAKEAEMNQIQAKTQEETETELKQLRRSLNFKATPMPSFYLEAVPRCSDGKTAVVTSKYPKLRCKSLSPGSGGAAGQGNSPAYSKVMANRQGISSSEFASIAQPRSPELMGDPAEDKLGHRRSRVSQGGKRIESVKKERERSKISVQQQLGGESKVRGKAEKVKERRMGGGKGEVAKGIVGGSSVMGRLAVDVAS